MSVFDTMNKLEELSKQVGSHDERRRCVDWIDTIRGAFPKSTDVYAVLTNLRKEIEAGTEPPQKSLL